MILRKYHDLLSVRQQRQVKFCKDCVCVTAIVQSLHRLCINSGCIHTLFIQKQLREQWQRGIERDNQTQALPFLCLHPDIVHTYKQAELALQWPVAASVILIKAILVIFFAFCYNKTCFIGLEHCMNPDILICKSWFWLMYCNNPINCGSSSKSWWHVILLINL